MAEIVSEDKVVLFRYTLTDASGEELDSSGEAALPYLHGAGNIVPGLEAEMDGKSVGDSFEVTVPPEEGYGQRRDGELVPFPKDSFPEEANLEEGMPFAVQTEGGQMLTVWVSEIGDQNVLMDPNHPLAGETLNFDVEIVKVRDATDEEVAHGHPHGPDGNSGH